jgi:RimJ/RimL family protein N-acetyltransferase
MSNDLTLATDRFELTPISGSASSEINRLIFSDPEVVKGLAHNTSTPHRATEETKRWCDRGPHSSPLGWSKFGLGFYTVRDQSGVFGQAGAVLGAAGLKLDFDDGPRVSGELIYAFGTAFHGAGIATEVASAICDEFFARVEGGQLTAHYWHVLNAASANVLRKAKFREDGYRSPAQVVGRDRATEIRNFELWRLQQAKPEHSTRIATEAAIKLGHLTRDGISTVDECVADLLKSVPPSEACSVPSELVAESVARGAAVDGFARVLRDN